jgi:membrane carboxypeptidase/penicillin-binding protein
VAFQPTDNVVGVKVNPQSGLLASEDCPVSRMTYYVKGSEPTEYCTKQTEGTEQEQAPTDQTAPEKKEKWWKKLVPWM